MNLNNMDTDLKKAHALQAKATAECREYFYQNTGKKNTELSMFDSANTEQSKLPPVLKSLFDSFGPEYQGNIDDAIRQGVEEYKRKNGGDLPHPSVIASALYAGKSVFDDMNTAKGAAVVSLLAASEQEAIRSNLNSAGFDDMSNLNYEQAAIVPALSVVTIANVIANALPMFASLPNANNSVRIPIVSIRLSTDSTFAAMKKGEFLDGVDAGLPYAEGRFEYALTTTDQKAYTVTATNAYLNYDNRTPDPAAAVLPILAANVAINVNGKEVGNSRGNRSNSVVTGTANIYANGKDVVIGGVTYKLTGGTVDVDTGVINANFDPALPASAVVEATLAVDFDAKDSNRQYRAKPVGVDIIPDYEEVQAIPTAQQVHLNFNVQSQLINETGFSFTSTALASIQGKLFLEQNLRLLKAGKRRAKFNGRVATFDITRGVTGNLTAAYNTTADMMSELHKFLTRAQIDIKQASGGATVKYDAFVGDNGAVFLNQLSADNFTSTGLTSAYGEIVRIGTLKDGTDVYHSPAAQRFITETDTTTEIVLVGRGSEPARNPFVGSITQAPTIRQSGADTREDMYGIHSTIAAELNPLDRYADQVAVVEITNLVNLKGTTGTV